jgi:hypothetical protein
MGKETAIERGKTRMDRRFVDQKRKGDVRGVCLDVFARFDGSIFSDSMQWQGARRREEVGINMDVKSLGRRGFHDEKDGGLRKKY